MDEKTKRRIIDIVTFGLIIVQAFFVFVQLPEAIRVQKEAIELLKKYEGNCSAYPFVKEKLYEIGYLIKSPEDEYVESVIERNLNLSLQQLYNISP